MKDLVPVAVLLRDQFGGYTPAEAFVARLAQNGRRALPLEGVQGDRRLMLDRALTDAGLLGDQGEPIRPRLAELTVLVDLLATVPDPPKALVADEPLLFTLPANAGGLVGVSDRIERRINDLIACATAQLVIGGPFWNQAGLDLLLPVLEPALRRGVRVRFYAHPQGEARDALLRNFVSRCANFGDVSLCWWRNGSVSLMHAKFVIADSSSGYLGTANLTSLGMDEHLEIGVPLGASQASRLVDVLETLTEQKLFVGD